MRDQPVWEQVEVRFATKPPKGGLAPAIATTTAPGGATVALCPGRVDGYAAGRPLWGLASEPRGGEHLLGRLDEQAVLDVWQLHTREWVLAGWHQKGSASVQAEFRASPAARPRSYDAVAAGRAWLLVVPEEEGLMEPRLLGFRSDGSTAFVEELYATLSEHAELSYDGVVYYAFVEGLNATE